MNHVPMCAHESDTTYRAFVVLPGAWHSAAHWGRVTAELTQRGHLALALDHPGTGLDSRRVRPHGNEVSPLAGQRIEIIRDAALAVVERLAAFAPVTLIAHSFGGLAASAVAECRPDLVDQLTYVTAFIPVPDGGPCSVADLNALEENASSRSGAPLVGDPETMGALRIDVHRADPSYVELGRDAFYNDLDLAGYQPYSRACWNRIYPCPSSPIRCPPPLLGGGGFPASTCVACRTRQFPRRCRAG